ncbi:MAG: rhodanese-like domain-containing protein [Ignavibacteriaceae bacterium]|nr:rhodanese-like domain-containing protein [Ignavibacteriaceae bacterium]
MARSVNNYSSGEVKERVKAGSILLDVRTSGERKVQSIPSSIHIPLHEISARLSELEKFRNREIICYCASGNRSVSAALRLKKAGFNVANLTGGISNWNFSSR